MSTSGRPEEFFGYQSNKVLLCLEYELDKRRATVYMERQILFEAPCLTSRRAHFCCKSMYYRALSAASSVMEKGTAVI